MSVLQLRDRGARVIGVARRADELKALAAETGCEWHTCDLSQQDQIARLLEELTEQGSTYW